MEPCRPTCKRIGVEARVEQSIDHRFAQHSARGHEEHGRVDVPRQERANRVVNNAKGYSAAHHAMSTARQCTNLISWFARTTQPTTTTLARARAGVRRWQRQPTNRQTWRKTNKATRTRPRPTPALRPSAALCVWLTVNGTCSTKKKGALRSFV